MCHRGMAEVVYRLNLSYTRPTYVITKADKNKQEKFKNDFEELKKCLNGLVDTIIPAYSPELNLIDGLCGWLKSSIINNSFFPTLPKVRVAVNKFIDEINKVPTKTIDRLCLKL